MKQPQIITAQDVANNKLRAASALVFIMERFIDYTTTPDWKESLKEIQKSFKEFVTARLEKGEQYDITTCLKHAFSYVASNEVFTSHEFVAAGAELSAKEYAEFLDELAAVGENPAKRKLVLPQLAAIGYEIMVFMMANDPDLLREIIAEQINMTEAIAASIIRKSTLKHVEPWKKATRILEEFEQLGIEVLKDGTYTDKDNRLEKEKEANARNSGKNTTATEGAEGISTTPEGSN